MVRERKKRKAKKDADFERKKTRVGRRISKKSASRYNNVTNTEVHAKKIMMKGSNSGDIAQSEVIKETKEVALILAKYLPLTDHHNKNHRKQAFYKILNILNQVKELRRVQFPKELLAPLFTKLGVAIVDKEKDIREVNIQIISSILSEQELWNVKPFLDVLILQIIVGMSSLSRGVRFSGTKLLLEVLQSEIYSSYVCQKYFDNLFQVSSAVLTASVQIIGKKAKSFSEHLKNISKVFQLLLSFLISINTPAVYQEPKLLLIEKDELDFNFKRLEKVKSTEGNFKLKENDLNSVFATLTNLLVLSKEKHFVESLITTTRCLALLKKLMESEHGSPVNFTLEKKVCQQFKSSLRFPLSIRNIGKFSKESVEVNINLLRVLRYLQNDYSLKFLKEVLKEGLYLEQEWMVEILKEVVKDDKVIYEISELYLRSILLKKDTKKHIGPELVLTCLKYSKDIDLTKDIIDLLLKQQLSSVVTKYLQSLEKGSMPISIPSNSPPEVLFYANHLRKEALAQV